MSIVRNAMPALAPAGTARIAIVASSPGEVEDHKGMLLNAVLGPAGITREQCFVGNVSQHRPPGNDFATFEWTGVEVQDGITNLLDDLRAFKPTFVLCLGNEALHVLKHGNVAPVKHKGASGMHFKWPSPISDWRGSLFWSTWAQCKCVATYHPAAVLRDFALQPYIKFDVRRAASEASTRELELPQRDIRVIENAAEAIDALLGCQHNKRPIVFDLEGGVSSMTAFGVADSAFEAFVVPLCRADGSSVWSSDEEVAILEALQRMMEDESVPKILQNALYDAFVLAWTYGIVVRGLAGDTMLQWHESFAELEKALGVQASILTREPFWKAERTSESDIVAWTYCGKDCAVTYECWQRMTEMLARDALSRAHYERNLASLEPLLYMELRGMRYDKRAARHALHEVERKALVEQHAVNEAARAARPALDELYRALGI